MIDHCRGLWGLPDIVKALSDCPTSLEWDDSHVVVDKAEVFECSSLCHSLNIFLAALTNCPYPLDGMCMSNLLRYYIYQQWDTCSYFYDNKKWEQIVLMYCDRDITRQQFSDPSFLIFCQIYMMAFVDLMTNLHFPVVIRLFIGTKMVGEPLLIAPDINNYMEEPDIGPHHTLDLCCMNDTYYLMKTSSMTFFKCFSLTCNAKKCLEKPHSCGLDVIRQFWV